MNRDASHAQVTSNNSPLWKTWANRR